MFNSSDAMSLSPRHGKRLQSRQLILADDLTQGGRPVGKSQKRMAFLFGKRRGIYSVHRDANKFQRQDCWGAGITLQLDSAPIQKCRIHIQEMMGGTPLLSSADARRASRSPRMEIIQSETSTTSGKPTFGSPSVHGWEDKSQENLDSSPSSGLDIPPLVYAAADSVSDTSEAIPPAPRFAQTVRRELQELQKTTTRSAVVGKINLASRSHRLSVGSEGSAEKGISPETEIAQRSELAAPSSISPSEFDFETLAKDQRTPPTMTPWISPAPTTTQPIIGCASAQILGGGNNQTLNNIRPASNVDELSGVDGLMPKFARRRSSPATHQAVSGEVDAEMYD